MNNKAPSLRKMFTTNFFNVVAFLGMFNTVAFFLIKRIYNEGVKNLLKTMGYSYLTKENISKVFSTTEGMIFIAIAIVLVGVFILFEANVLFVTYRATYRGNVLSFSDMIYYGMANIKTIYIWRWIPVLILITYITIVVCLFGIYQYIILNNTYLTSIRLFLKSHKVGNWIYVAIAFLVLIGLSVIFTPLFMYFEKKSFPKSIKRSFGLWKKNIVSFLFKYILLNAILIGGFYAMLIGLNIVSVNLLKEYVDVLIRLNLAMIICDNIRFVLLVGYTILSIMLNVSLTVYLYYRKQENSSIEIPLLEHRGINRKRDMFFVCMMLTTIILLGVNALYVVNNEKDIFSYSKNYMYVTAHRGSSLDAPENTMPAIELAIESMADYIEFDVRETSDGILVLMHDAKATRTTGKSLKIWNTSYDELYRLDVGEWRGKKYINTKIPRFEEVLEYCKDKKIVLNIEIKYNKNTPDITEHVMEIIEEYEIVDKCVISSTTEEVLIEVKNINADIPTGKIITYDYENEYNDDYIDFYSMRSGFITKSKVMKIHENGKEIHAWTVNTVSELTRCQRLGVDNIITDMPILAKSVFVENSEPSTMYEYINILINKE